MVTCPKTLHLIDKKYRGSFGKFHEHKCLLTGAEFTEFSSESIDGAHITIGRYGHSMKPWDDLILPFCHSIHMEFDRNQRQFIDENFSLFALWGWGEFKLDTRDYTDNIAFVKACAQAYYKKWKADQ